MMPPNEIVVVDLAGAVARTYCSDANSISKLSQLGFIQEGSQFVRKIGDPAERKALALQLMRLDALFSEGKDWSPAELMESFRDQGIVQGKFRTIAWHDPQTYSIDTR